MISLHLYDGHQQCQMATFCHPNMEHRQTDRQTAKKLTRYEGWVREWMQQYIIYDFKWQILRPKNAAQTNTSLIKRIRQLGLNENIITEWSSEQTVSTVFPRHTFSPNNAAFSILHSVWQTHGFMVRKMAFQRVIINNSVMTNSSDIYTALGVWLTLTGRQ